MRTSIDIHKLMACLAIGLLFLGACTKKEEGIDKVAFLKMAQKYDPTVKTVLPKDLNSGIRCKKDNGALIYGEGCLTGFLIQVGPLDMDVIEYKTEEQARLDALRLDQYYYKNWIFDNVTNEPILEEFVKKTFNAQRPSQKSVK